MYRKVEDFIQDWQVSADGTLQVLKALTNEKLDQAIVEGHSTLGWLAWHLVGAAGGFGQFAGLNIEAPQPDQPIPSDVTVIVDAYERVIASYQEEAVKLTDESLLEEVNGFTGPTPRGALLRALIDHQTHHRGQMTVLLRQAGLTVPPVMGPTQEMQ